MTGQRLGLGRGLGALLGGDDPEGEMGRRIRMVPVDRIDPNPRQPRHNPDGEALNELADSIREHGILQPLLVRIPREGVEGRYELIAGERRLRAARLAGLERVPVLVEEMDDGQSLEVAILENVQREDLNVVEAARGYQRLVQEFGYSHARVAQRVGKSRMAVTNMLRLLKLPPEVLAQVVAGELSGGHARALLAVADNPDSVMALARAVHVQGLNVRQTERMVRENAENSEEKQTVVNNVKRQPARRDPAAMVFEKRLASQLQVRVTITQTRGRGKVILEYASPEDLERLARKLLGEGGQDSVGLEVVDR
ncbi:MAG: ParB/RepB/Spo0J family partition protein [Magnetococcales bacterium]|nr:ParB/RepB/Spo0J family partition protein [Magnetococcales bacterium]